MWYDAIFTSLGTDDLGNASSCWLDVRDVGIGHAHALQKPDVGGRRIVLSLSGKLSTCASNRPLIEKLRPYRAFHLE